MGNVCANEHSTPANARKDPLVYRTKINNTIYEVLLGDICYEHVDAIVNSANSHLLHNTGISGSIVVKGGNEIQVESTKYIEEHGPLTVGDAVHTNAGKLKCKYVIHAVLPVWIGGDGNEQERLTEALENTLNKAEELKVRSIAFPALGGGVFGFPRDMAAEIMVSNTIRLLNAKPESTITTVKFMNFDMPTIKFFKHELEKYQRENTEDYTELTKEQMEAKEVKSPEIVEKSTLASQSNIETQEASVVPADSTVIAHETVHTESHPVVVETQVEASHPEFPQEITFIKPIEETVPVVTETITTTTTVVDSKPPVEVVETETRVVTEEVPVETTVEEPIQEHLAETEAAGVEQLEVA